ncbi:MAG TPA: carboxypeptidase-like regulatory domain-containing protein, partial [Planctomycetota bacterium]|nr:carboxypeptidase-like regulatory domain-containing protein [Planctomycetota bacterium]
IVAFTDSLVRGARELGVSDADGRFRAPFIEDSATLRAVVDGRAASPAVELSPTRAKATLRLGDAAATVVGTVLDRNGAPLAHAPVAIQPEPPPRGGVAPLLVIADAHGAFAAHSVPPGRCSVVAVRLLEDGQSRLARVEADASAGRETRADVRFPAGARLDVRLRRADGRALVSSHVTVWLQRPAFAKALQRLGGALVVTDENGEGRAEGLMPGRYEVMVSTPDALVRETVDLADGETRRFEPSLENSASASVRVTVVDAARRPLAGWIVRAELAGGRRGSESAVTDADGSATLRPLSEPIRRVHAQRTQRSFAAASSDVVPGATAAIVVADAATRPGAIRGTLATAAGVPFAGLRVDVRRGEGDNPLATEGIEVECDATTGAFALTDVPPGRYHLGVRGADARSVLAMRTGIAVGAQPVDVGAIPIGLGSIAVSATFADGRAVAGIGGAVGDLGVFVPAPRQEGEVRLLVSELPAGSVELLVWGSTMAPFVQRVDVRAGVMAELPVVAAPGAPVVVRVPGADVPFGFLRVKGALTLGVGVDPRAELVRGFAPGGYELEFDDLRGNRFGASLTIGADLAPRTVTLAPRR